MNLARYLLALLLMPIAASAGKQPDGDDARALLRGRDQALPCLQRMEHDADEFLDCVRSRAGRFAGEARPASLSRLGVYWYGWVIADAHAAYALDGAEAAASQLLELAEPLRQSLKVEPEELCGLVDLRCAELLDRWRARQP